MDGRLRACGRLVRKGAILLDVGSDHAFLPIALLREGRIRAAVATDLNEGPIRRAAENIAAAGLSRSIRAIRRDGLHGSAGDAPRATDIVIAGMGGELIAHILADPEAAWVRDAGVRLILQPMTKQGVLRRWLWDAGFATDTELLIPKGDGSVYQIIAAHYAPTERGDTLTEAEAAYGRENLARMDAATKELLAGEKARLQKAIHARQLMQRQKTEAEIADEALLAQIETIGKENSHDEP